MMVYVNYISSIYRLKELEKSVIMLGGEHEAPEMVRAQRDFVKLEKEYFGEQCIKTSIILTGIITGLILSFITWSKLNA